MAPAQVGCRKVTALRPVVPILLLALLVAPGNVFVAGQPGTCNGTFDTYLPANSKTTRQGVLNPAFPPVAQIKSGDIITIECVTWSCPYDFAKMIQGDPGVEDIFYWPQGTAAINKPVPVYPNNGGHIITGPVYVCGAEPGDVLKVEILDIIPRKNPATGKCYGINSSFKGAGYPSRVPTYDGGNYSTSNAIGNTIIYEVTEDEYGAWGYPIYGFQNPSGIVSPDGKPDGPGVVYPHKTNVGISSAPITYPPGFQSYINSSLSSNGLSDMSYVNSTLNYRIPLRPHLGCLGLYPANADNFKKGADNGTAGTSTTAPSKFGGNLDDWRIGAGATMYYGVEVPGAGVWLGDCHAAEGDGEVSQTGIETSLTPTFRITVLKKATLPPGLQNLSFPILETKKEIVVHGLSYNDYLSELTFPINVTADGFGPDISKPFKNAYINTRNFLIQGFNLTELEAISILATGVDFDVTQVVDGNWGVHGVIRKEIFSKRPTSSGQHLFTGPGLRKMMATQDQPQALDINEDRLKDLTPRQLRGLENLAYKKLHEMLDEVHGTKSA